jgi:hypothetical protein
MNRGDTRRAEQHSRQKPREQARTPDAGALECFNGMFSSASRVLRSKLGDEHREKTMGWRAQASSVLLATRQRQTARTVRS